MIWSVTPNIKFINNLGKNTLAEHLNMKLTEVGDDYLIATMPVDNTTTQTMGILHGGASAALAESIGSIASFLVIGGTTNKVAVGLELNANHLRPVKSGVVSACAKPIKLGKTIHVWEINIKDDHSNLVCTSRLTMLISDIS